VRISDRGLPRHTTNYVEIGKTLWTYGRTDTRTHLTSVGLTVRSSSGDDLKINNQSYFTHVPGRPHWDDCFEFWHAG